MAANPMLVLAGVVVGVIAAGYGATQVPGWVDNVNDGAVRNDLANVSISQEASYTVASRYEDTISGLKAGVVDDIAGVDVKTGVKFQSSAGAVLALDVSADRSKWAAVGVSKSGHVFVRTSDSSEVYTSDSKDYATAIGNLRNAKGDSLSGVTLGGTAQAPTISIP